MRIRVARRRFVPVLFSLSLTPVQTETDAGGQFTVESRRRAGARLDSAARGG